MYQLMFFAGAAGGAVLIEGLGKGSAAEGDGDGSGDPDGTEGSGSDRLRKVGCAAQPHTSRAGAAASNERRGIRTQQSVRL
jgi:hypothetical protein